MDYLGYLLYAGIIAFVYLRARRKRHRRMHIRKIDKEVVEDQESQDEVLLSPETSRNSIKAIIDKNGHLYGLEEVDNMLFEYPINRCGKKTGKGRCLKGQSIDSYKSEILI